MPHHYVRMGQPDERQLPPGLEPKDIDRGTPERKRLNRIKSDNELEMEIVGKAERKAAKARLRLNPAARLR